MRSVQWGFTLYSWSSWVRTFASGVPVLLLLGCGVADRRFSPGGESWPAPDWRQSAPEKQGVDSALLARADGHIRNDLPHFRSLLVVRHGVLIWERYYHGASPDVPEAVMSVTKSFLSALVGIAIEKGYLRGTDAKLPEFFPDLSSRSADRAKREIALVDFLTMTSGLSWGPRTALWNSPDWVRAILEMPMDSSPGQRFFYGDAGWPVHLLSAILTLRTGMSTREFAERHLFRPLGIRAGAWDSDPQGISAGITGLHLTSRDLARFGYLYLRVGRWEKLQVVPATWVSESTRQHNTGGPPELAGYAFLWWVTDETGYDAYFAAGYGGQFIYEFAFLGFRRGPTTGTADLGGATRFGGAPDLSPGGDVSYFTGSV